MNKAFVREPVFDGQAYCPRCGALGVPVHEGPLDTHIQADSRAKMQGAAWFCSFARCDVAYFNLFETVVEVDELKTQFYPFDLDAPICACFNFTYDDVEADVRDGHPTRIRQLLARSQSSDAHCETLSPDGRCCLGEVQKLYMKLRSEETIE